MIDPTISISYRVETRADYLDGCPSPWMPGLIAWNNPEGAIEQAENARACHVESGATHRLDVRVVKVVTQVMRVFRDPKGEGDKGE